MIDKCVIMGLDKRKNMWGSLLFDCVVQHGFNTEVFISGDGSDKALKYDYIDGKELPPLLNGSTNYSTWFNRPGPFNMWKAQQQVFTKYSKDQSVKILWHVEDDMRFCSNWAEIYPTIIQWSNENEWDMLYLGSFLNIKDFSFVYPNILKLNGLPAGGFHSVLIKQHILSILAELDPLGPYDEICHKYIHKNFKCYAVYPQITCQKPAFSYIENQWFGREDQQW